MALRWAVRCLPGLSVLAILILSELAFQIFQTAYIGLSYPTGLVTGHNPVSAQLLFVAYSVFIHVVALIFPFRLCRSVWQASTAVREIYGPGGNYTAPVKAKAEDAPAPQQSRSDAQGQYQVGHIDTVHAIMIPSYKEEISVLEETLKVLASHTLATTTYDVFLAMEDRDPNAISVATKLQASFRHRFKDIQHTIHPSDIPGEVPGKSSNISWAAQQVQRKYHGSRNWKDVLLTVMDSDTHLLSDYFKIVLRRHIHNRRHGNVTDMTMYMPPIIFDRNAHLVPIMVRVADLMWCGAGLSCFQSKPGRTGIAFPTAVYTITLPLVHLVEGWDTDAGAVGEDMHMMLKCYFATNGKLAFESIPSPASQCNISSSKSGIRGWLDSHRARYSQGLRHMWGCLDAGYTIDRWSKLGSKPPPSLHSHKLSRHSELELKLSHYQVHGDQGYRLTWRNVMLLTRVFEAHFLPIHLLVVMVFSTVYTNLAAPLVHCRFLTMFLDFTAALRALSFIIMLFYFFVFYEDYHHVCVEAREAEMRRVGLYEEMEDSFSKRRPGEPRTWLDYLLFPVAGSLFGSAPLMHAALAHFWSDRLDYKVSVKPTRAPRKDSSESSTEEA